MCSPTASPSFLHAGALTYRDDLPREKITGCAHDPGGHRTRPHRTTWTPRCAPRQRSGRPARTWPIDTFRSCSPKHVPRAPPSRSEYSGIRAQEQASTHRRRAGRVDIAHGISDLTESTHQRSQTRQRTVNCASLASVSFSSSRAAIRNYRALSQFPRRRNGARRA